ncbi:MAG: lipid IV(A) 3-deoxy-D-manno-octulosonic acid transferase, partial [Gammaproteobacteria bacterium]
LLSPLLLLRLWWRGRRNPGYRKRIGERFGLYSRPPARDCIWIHAVSVGESQATQPIMRWISETWPEIPVVISTTTPTGAERVEQMYRDSVQHIYFPYDLPDAIGRALRTLKPRLLVVMETEIWPNLMRQCVASGVPVVLANARLSAASARGYGRIRRLIAPAVGRFSQIAAQNDADAQRFVELGADPARVHVCGSVKFDVRIPASVREHGELLRMAWGTGRHVWVAASTHPGEDELLLDVHKAILARYPDALLVLTPRHPERFDAVAALVESRGFGYCRRSRMPVCKPSSQVYLGDTMGELTVFFAAADVAFVAGSLVPIGGHNVLEPASLGLPVIVGPHMHNFLGITRLMTDAGALVQVADSRELEKALIELFDNVEKRTAMGLAGLDVVKRNQGALECVASLLRQSIGPAS